MTKKDGSWNVGSRHVVTANTKTKNDDSRVTIGRDQGYRKNGKDRSRK